MNKSDAPKISIIIPVYNAEKYLRQCLDSVVNQTLKEIEILCINDGSTDSSLDILNEYAEQDKRIKVFSQKNSGPATARNVGLDNATGDYLWFIDADDWCELNACEYLTKTIKKSDADIIGFSCKSWNNASNRYTDDTTRNLILFPNSFFNKKFKISTHPDIFYKLPTEAWNKIFKKTFLIQNNFFFNKKLWGMDDGYFTEQTFLHASSIYYIKDALYNYRTSQSHSIVSRLINPTFKNYKVTIKYAEETDKLIEHMDINTQISFPLFIKNINRMIYYLYRCKGIIQYLYFHKTKKYLEKKFSMYPTLLNDKNLSNHTNIILNNHFFEFYKKHIRKKRNSFLKKETVIKKECFYDIKITKYYIGKIKIFKKKNKTFNPVAFQESLLVKIQRSLNIMSLHQKTFSEFKNIHEGQEIVLVGAGPTTAYYQYIKNIKHVACSRAILRKDINFDYIFAIDKIGIESIVPLIQNYKNPNCVKFIGDINHGEGYQIPESFRLKCNARTYKTTCGITSARFVLDIDREPLGSFHSVAFQAIQFILFTNPKKIYLVGMDCAHQGSHFAGKEHFVSSRGEDINLLQQAQIKEWKLLKKFVSLYYPDTKIISINPVGLKGIFDDIYTKTYLKNIQSPTKTI